MPMVRAIEPHKHWFKEHLHMIIRFQDLNKPYTAQEIESFIRETCNGFKEVNERDATSVFIRMFHYWNDTNELGNSIEYICKTSSFTYDPLIERT
jgi:hypothetical protein